MLPNFRKSDAESQKPALSAVPSEPNAPRPVFAMPRAAQQGVPSHIGADLVITGNLTSKGEVHVDGIVEGDIQGALVVVGETATVTGGIIAEEVVVRGHIVGSVRSKRVMLQSTSQVDGDIYHQSLSIEQGALFEGKSRRSKEDPRTIELKPAVAVVAEAQTPAFFAPPKLPELH